MERPVEVTIKLAVPELSDRMMYMIETHLNKYKLVKMEKPVRTIIQRYPLDFINVDASEVWIIKAKLDYPVSSYVLWEELRQLLKIPAANIIVRLDSEPLEKYQNLSVEEPEDVSKIAGNEYNESFKKLLAKTAKSRDYGLGRRYPAYDDDFNRGIEGVPSVVPPDKVVARNTSFEKYREEHLSKYGNFYR